MGKQLQNLKKEIEKLLKEFLEKKQREAKKLSPLYFALVNQIASIALSGGKRLRPLLVYYGYKAFGSPKINRCDKKLHVHDFVTEKDLEKEVLKLSLAVELFHVACLIHDDIMDNAKTRRGEPTIQKYFENYFSCHSDRARRASGGILLNKIDLRKIPRLTSFTRDDSVSLARNIAILAGDLALVWADELFWKSGIDPRVLVKVKPYFDQLREEVIVGQTSDLVLGKNANENEIFKMYEYKTARYSFVRPLQLGAKLAGASASELKILNDYATPVGIAFQIQDDILGTFGDKTGKDSDSDIKEGKETLLIHISKIKNQKSRLRQDFGGQAKSKNKLEQILGNRNASKEDINWVRNLIKESGALKYCQDKAEKLIQESKKVLKKSTFSPETKDFLFWLADFCLARDK